jgi:hypothetical protein
MTEAFSSIKNSSSLKETNSSYENENKMKKGERKNSINSLSSECSFNNLNGEINSIIENETDLSFSSNSNSDIEENKANIEQLFDSKYWRVNKEINSETEEPNSTFESQNEKESPTKKNKDKFIFIDSKNSQKLFKPKYIEAQEMTGISVGSNKQSTQSNEDEENPGEHLQNVSSFESNNNSSSHNESEEKEKEKKIEEEKKEKENIIINNSNTNNNIQNLKYNKINEQEYLYSYEPMNYKNNNLQFFPGVYLPPPMYSFMPSYNYPSLNKKNYITNHNNNLNNKSDGNNSPDKNDQNKPNTNIK